MSTGWRLCLAGALLLAAQNASGAPDWPYKTLYQKDGVTTLDQFGYSVAGAGDVNGDGHDDFIIGAPDYDIDLGDEGAVYVYDGATGAWLYSQFGSGSGDHFGASVAGIGDVNNNGYDDFAVGAPQYDVSGMVDAGLVRVVDGQYGLELYSLFGTAAGDQFGRCVAGAGDVNNDGYDDIIVGAPFATDHAIPYGLAYVYDGLTGAQLFQKRGETNGDRFGTSVAGLGDINGNGYDDFIIGAYLHDGATYTDAGAAYVYDGESGTELYRKEGAYFYEHFGWSVAGAGDVDGDTYGDFLVGAPGEPSASNLNGHVYLYNGSTGGQLRKMSHTGLADRFGWSVSGAGDFDGDTFDDIIAGAPQAAPGGQADAGSAYIYNGLTGALLLQVDGEAAGDKLGASVGNAGEFYNDGQSDVIIGAYQTDPNGQADAGSAYVIGLATVRLSALNDLPNDQGKQMRLRWRTSPIEDAIVDAFAVFRRQDDAKRTTIPPPYSAWASSMPEGNWDYVAGVPAFGDTAYQTIVATVADSTINDGMHYSVFFVRAATDNPLMYIDSPIDSGFSLDNLAPSPPPFLMAALQGPDAVLDWGPVFDADFDYYWIYRGDSPGFVPDDSKRIGATSDTSFLDSAVPGATGYYKVCAVDFSGNEGNPSAEASVSTCDCPHQCDYDDDGFLTSLDLGFLIDVLFAGRPEVTDPSCPTSRGDFDCDGFPTSLDLGGLIDHLFAGGPPPCDPCSP